MAQWVVFPKNMRNLTEMGVRDGKIDYAVIGVGINVISESFRRRWQTRLHPLESKRGHLTGPDSLRLVMEALRKLMRDWRWTCDLSGLKRI